MQHAAHLYMYSICNIANDVLCNMYTVGVVGGVGGGGVGLTVTFVMAVVLIGAAVFVGNIKQKTEYSMQQSIINTASALIATVVSIACDNAFVTGGVLSLPFFLIGGFAP